MKINSKKYNRRFVIADIHGCFDTFKELVEKKIKLSKQDALFLLGDYIDRGRNSSKVVDYIIEMIENKYNIFPLRGNHEHDILDANEKYDTKTLYFFQKRFFKSQSLIDKETGLKEKYKAFFSSLKFYYELEDFYLVHAGFDFSHENPFTTPTKMLYVRSFKNDTKITGNKKIIHGHQPHYIEDITKIIKNRENIIPLDNGCYYHKPHKLFDYTRLSNLLCY